MIDELYQKSLLRLAANATGDGRIDNPDAEETADNPTCGDRITLQIRMNESNITELKHHNRSCMLCQASASMIGEHAVGKSLEDILQTRENLHSMLQGGTIPDTSEWKELELFNVVAAHKSRHHCVLLPFDALIRALETALKKA
ncbi:Fe-S cluster assembly sulfur transfer protein SufU [Sneathiella sp.]|uniref:Fe-S cluster assembly sulfur transfer protein SufU n=1 Tax=Sneathiella sp. TaxID=1964365 RepID=UPI0026178345|nr:SUF system NifU family Fe-S cluster assembly protein [Sneathiella sp.]MDF2368402.1 SUF system NifU family Fe-S cluster assembly protein [Sneathiella sp.]